MLRVPISEARAGMVLAQSIPHPTLPTSMLLRRGAALDDACIPRLAQLGVREVWIGYPGLEAIAKFCDPRVSAASREITAQTAAIIDSAMLQTRVELDYVAYRRTMMGLIGAVMSNPAAGLFVSAIAGGDQALLRHSGNVAVLSLLMGIKLEFYLIRERKRMSGADAKDISALGVGAMLADIAFTRTPPDQLASWIATRDEADPVWTTHAQAGFDLVTDQVDPVAAGVVLHHHQAYDGSGFPHRIELSGTARRLAGSEIHVFARIAAAADLYNRLRYPAHAPGMRDADHPPIPGVRALSRLLQPGMRERVDPVVLRALMAVAPPFPPGSLVTLSDGRRAAVVGTCAADPCRPPVEILADVAPPPRRGRGGTPPNERIDLHKADGLTIVAIDGHDVRADLFEPSSPGEFDLVRASRSMHNRAEGGLAA